MESATTRQTRGCPNSQFVILNSSLVVYATTGQINLDEDAIMSDTQCVNRCRFVATTILVCLASTGIGFVASAFAGLGYGLNYRYNPAQGELPVDPVLSMLALYLGTTASLFAGVFWCFFMHRRLCQQGAGNLLAGGITYGLKAGVAATLVLHGGLILNILLHAPGRLDLNALVFVGIGLVCGVVAGLILGAVGGYLVSRCVSVAESTPPPSTPPTPDSASGTNEASTHDHAN
jgi:hypothetical protein